MFVWSKGIVATVKARWAEGASASDIARELGGGVTRNAVIGKLHRLGLKRPQATRTQTQRDAAKAHLRRGRPKKATAKPQPEPPKKRALHLVEDSRPLAPDPGPGIVRFLDRTSNQCAWPKWPTQGSTPLAEKMCCGQPIVQGKLQPYCAHHQRLGHSPGSLSEQGAMKAARAVARAEAA